MLFHVLVLLILSLVLVVDSADVIVVIVFDAFVGDIDFIIVFIFVGVVIGC